MRKVIRLLIVDDNPADYNLLRRNAEKGLRYVASVQAQHVECEKDCFELLETFEFDCVFLDYQLGSENGLDVLRKMRDRSLSIPVIMLTGEGDETVAVTAMKMGASDYIVKENATSDTIGLAVGSAIEKADLYAKLKDKQTELEHFAYTAAHDIKSPLAVINQTAQLILEKAAEHDDKELMEWSRTLGDVSEGVADFVTELLDYAKVGRSCQRFEEVDLKDIVKKTIRNLAVMIEENDAIVEFDERLPVINGDPVALLQFFQNLIANGIKFRKPDVRPMVRVFCRELDENEGQFDYKICVADNGVGIDEKNHKKIFSPLVRLQRTEKVEGSGLGLSIAKKIAEQHKSEIWVESSIGEGATICILVHNDPDKAQN